MSATATNISSICDTAQYIQTKTQGSIQGGGVSVVTPLNIPKMPCFSKFPLLADDRPVTPPPLCLSLDTALKPPKPASSTILSHAESQQPRILAEIERMSQNYQQHAASNVSSSNWWSAALGCHYELFVQEHWLIEERLRIFSNEINGIACQGVSGLNSSKRPYGGCSVLWKSDITGTKTAIQTQSKRLCYFLTSVMITIY